jgi:hypothetical protein
MTDTARPPILKTADFSGITPYNFVIAVTEKRRIKANKVYTVAFNGLENFKIISEDKAINHFNISFSFILLA